MVIEYAVGDKVLIKGTITHIDIGENNEACYSVRVKGFEEFEAYGIRVKAEEVKKDE